MQKQSLLTFALSGLLILSSCGLQTAPNNPTAGSLPAGTSMTFKENDIFESALNSRSFQKALKLLASENIRVNLNEVVKKDNQGMAVFALSTSLNDLMIYVSVPEDGEALTQAVMRDDGGHILATDIGSSRVQEFDSRLQVVRSGWSVSEKNLSSLFVMGNQRPVVNSLNLTDQGCTVPDDMYTDLYFAQNEAQNASDAQVAAALAYAAADFALLLCFGGPAACAGAVSAFALAAINLNVTSKAVTTANKKVQEQMRRINEWRRTNCS